MPADYPARFSVAYPDRALNRASTIFRLILAIPILIILGLLIGGGGSGAENQEGHMGMAGLVVLPVLLFILFRLKYPRWWFDWNLALSRFTARVGAYMLLLDDTYPSAEDEQAVRLDLDYPNVAKDLNRWLPLVKWLLAIPHFVILALLTVAAVFAVIAAWFAIVFTARYPRGLFDFVVGVLRWHVRVGAYCVLLITDQYPPFSLWEDEKPGRSSGRELKNEKREIKAAPRKAAKAVKKSAKAAKKAPSQKRKVVKKATKKK